MTSNRKCDACEGTGEIAWDDDAFYGPNPPNDCRCPACSGRGWQSVELTDAEIRDEISVRRGEALMQDPDFEREG